MSIAGIVVDTETTGVDTDNDRIVTAFIGAIDENGAELWRREWLIDPAAPYRDECESEADDIADAIDEDLAAASKVHGITREVLDNSPATRTDVPVAIFEIAALIHSECSQKQQPLMGMNLSYDLSLLNAELRRHGYPQLVFGRSTHPIYVLDARVLDGHYDRYRKGARKLINLAKHYGIPFTEEEAHAADFDAITSGRIIQKILAKYAPYFAANPDRQEALRALHYSQIQWHAAWAAHYQEYLRSPKAGAKRDQNAVIDGSWPVRTVTA